VLISQAGKETPCTYNFNFDLILILYSDWPMDRMIGCSNPCGGKRFFFFKTPGIAEAHCSTILTII
jgi:hypothetical protein